MAPVRSRPRSHVHHGRSWHYLKGAPVRPTNDALANAQTITGMSGSTTGNLWEATLEVGEVLPSSPFNPLGITAPQSVWYVWTPASTQTQTFDTGFNLNNTVLAIYSGPASSPTFGALVPVAFNDDIGRIYPAFDVYYTSSRASFDAVSGTTYYIQVLAKTPVGGFTLTWAKSPVIRMTLVTGVTASGVRNITSGAITAAAHFTLIDTPSLASASVIMSSLYTATADGTDDVQLFSADRVYFPANTYMTVKAFAGKSTAVTMRAAFTLRCVSPITFNAVFFVATSAAVGLDSPTTDGSSETDFQFEVSTRLVMSSQASGFLSSAGDTPLVTTVPLKIIQPVMKAPIIVNGRPIHPAQVLVSPTSLTATGRRKVKPTPDAITITTPETSVKKISTHTWLASEFPFPEGVYGDHWPAHNGKGPTWHSQYPYRPRRQFYDGQVSYNSVLVFWWHYVEHMWAKFDHPQPFTFVITGILHGGSSNQNQHLIDGVSDSFGGSTVFDTPNGVFGVPTETHHHVSARFKPTQIQQAAGSTYSAKGDLHEKAAVYTLCFNGASSYVDVHMQGHHRHVSGHTGTNDAQFILLGRFADHISPFWATHMSLLEVQFFNSALSEPERKYVIHHLYGAYSLDQW